MALSEHFHDASQGAECVNGCWVLCLTTVCSVCSLQLSAPSPGPHLHHLPKQEARGLAVLWDEFHRKTTLTSPPHKFSFLSSAQQSQQHTALTSVLSWLASDPSRRLQVPGTSTAPVKHLLPMCSSWRPQACSKVQLPAQSSSPQGVPSCSQHCPISAALCIQAQLFAETARKAPCMLLS